MSWQHLGASCSKVPNVSLTGAVESCPTMSKSLLCLLQGAVGTCAGALAEAGKGRLLAGSSSLALGAVALLGLLGSWAALVALFWILSGVKGALVLGVRCKGPLPSVAYISLSCQSSSPLSK